MFRDAVPSDWDAIVALHKDQQTAQGSNFELPWLFRHPIVAAIVGVDDDGVVRHCFYGEAIVEMRHVGLDPRCTALAQRESEGFAYMLKAMGYRWLETFVPRRLAKMIGKPLWRAGFECVDKELAHYSRDLREKP
jgi:hypothetical protein